MSELFDSYVQDCEVEKKKASGLIQSLSTAGADAGKDDDSGWRFGIDLAAHSRTFGHLTVSMPSNKA